jgi:hypothetical protein
MLGVHFHFPAASNRPNSSLFLLRPYHATSKDILLETVEACAWHERYIKRKDNLLWKAARHWQSSEGRLRCRTGVQIHWSISKHKPSYKFHSSPVKLPEDIVPDLNRRDIRNGRHFASHSPEASYPS